MLGSPLPIGTSLGSKRILTPGWQRVVLQTSLALEIDS